MGHRPTVYGLDIETDTTENGLDPQVASVVTVALSAPGLDEVFSGRESTILFDVDQRLRGLPAGVLATWNGAAFDLPFLADRAARHGLELGLRLQFDPTLAMRRARCPATGAPTAAPGTSTATSTPTGSTGATSARASGCRAR